MKRRIITLLLAALVGPLASCAVVYAQRKGAAPQSTFGTEMPIKRPVKLPAEVLSQLIAENRETLAGCFERHKETEAQARKYFAASEFDVNGDGQTDLIVQAGEYCLQGAHSTPFWIFTHTQTRLVARYDLAFSSQGDALKVLPGVTNGYRDLEDAYYTAAEAYSTVWKFDGSAYQPRECRVTDFQTRRTVRVSCRQ